MRNFVWPPEDSSSPATTSTNLLPRIPPPPPSPPNCSNSKQSYSNVFNLLARREVSPRMKGSSRKFWKEESKCDGDSADLRGQATDVRRSLISWVEAESLQHFSAKYSPLLPPPRSTIAAAFSHDGKWLASTHGDHTVKIIDCQTGRVLKVLSGHRRTPWVVRFHPLYPEILASGSLDHEVRLWDARTAVCIASHDFYRPIASIAFHAQGEFLAVASGHKLYIWHYRGEPSSPSIVLKTRRSLRAVHFHPHATPFLLTAEVNELEPSDPTVTVATCQNYSRYPLPDVYLADTHSGYQSNPVNELPLITLPFLMWPSIGRVDERIPLQHAGPNINSTNAVQRTNPSTSVRLLTYSTPSGQYELLLSPVEPGSSTVPDEHVGNSFSRDMENDVSEHTTDAMETEVQPEERGNQIFPLVDPSCWEVPFLQEWLIGQSQAGQQRISPLNGGASENLSGINRIDNPVSTAPLIMPNSSGKSRVIERSGSRHLARPRASANGFDGEPSGNIAFDGSDSQPSVNQIQAEIAASLAAAAAELPCTVKLRLWAHNIKDPCQLLDAEKCRLIIPHAVLCSEMGAHFSPCGRFLGACVPCVLPNVEADPSFQGHIHHDTTWVATSPTRHPIAASRVMYELRVYSLEEATFGLVLASRAIRAAHCLTSIQFSPTSEHLLLAYGRRHSSLLKSVLIDGGTAVPMYTILEVYRVSDMELVRVLPSAEDEVNVACFHPSVGGGLVYGTKEGKLRIFQYDISYGLKYSGSSSSDEDMLEGVVSAH